jgi:hypothetical protein
MSVLDDGIQSRSRQNDVSTLRRISPGELRSAAAWNHREIRVVGRFQNLRELLLVAGRYNELRLHASDAIFARGVVNVFRANNRARCGLKRGDALRCVSWCARVHG